MIDVWHDNCNVLHMVLFVTVRKWKYMYLICFRFRPLRNWGSRNEEY